MRAVKYDPRYRQDFIRFNQDWILDNFGFLEKEDIETFEKIDEELDEGAMIFFAVEDDVPLAWFSGD